MQECGVEVVKQNNCVVKKRDVQRAKAGANKIFKKLIFDSIEDREDTKDRDK